MTIDRRTLVTGGLAALASRKVFALVSPNGSVARATTTGVAKIFHLRAEPVHHVIAPGLEMEAWGYNGSTPGPVLEATEGDRVRIYVTNALPEATSIHWHGVFVPNGMDGVAGLTQKSIE
ncbi:MAG TPA: multicopper oxidase domain-containing protein, partial [Kofleriaceae bacterium]|nr:multicopper oxidase domain-containing protein [Kofleriaceae bacterium]